MEANNWIVGQIVIDILIALVLLWFIFVHSRKKGSENNFEEDFQKSESILSEMTEITQVLERNLDEKRELSNRILQKLDEGLKRAEERYLEIQKITKRYGNDLTHNSGTLTDTEKTRASIKTLLKKGLSKVEISQHLGISLGEIDLLLKLQM